MRKLFYFLMLLPAALHAQQQKPYDMLINGVRVIVVPSGNEIVQVDMVVKGGVQNYPAAKAGIENLAITALTECGTLHDDKNSFKNKLDEVDARIYGYAGRDAAHFQMNCIKDDLGTVWPLYVDAITIPKFDAKEFARIKEDAVNGLRQEQSNPDAALQRMALETAFKGMDYAKSPTGTINIVQKLTPAETKAYLQSVLTRTHLFFVIVGDISKEDVQSKMTALIAKISPGKPFTLKRSTYTPAANSFVSKEKENATNYIMGISGAPAATSKEYLASRLASGIFYDKMFLEVRTNNGLSYAPAAYITNNLTPYSVLYVTTTEPDKYVAVARTLIDSIKMNGFADNAIKNMKNTYTTYQYYNNEANASLCSMVAGAELLQDDWHKAFTLKEDMQNVSGTDVNNVFNKYINHFTWVYEGDPKKVNPKLFTQKETPALPKEVKTF